MKRILRSLTLGFMGMLLFTACSDDKETEVVPGPEESTNKDTWIIYNGNANWSGGIYALKDNKSEEINLGNVPFFQVTSSLGGRLLGDKLYKVNSASNAQGILKLGLNANGNVVEDKFLASLSNAYITNFLIVSETEGYYWDNVRGGLKVQKFNPTSMERTGEIDFSSLSEGLPYESAGELVLAKRDDYLYVDLCLGTKATGNWQFTPKEKNVSIAVYDLKNDKIVNVTKFDGTTNLGMFIDHVAFSIDEVTKDLYFMAVGDMKTQLAENSSKIVRIKNGETQFDPSFALDIKDYQFKAEFTRIFAHNGKIYTTIPSRSVSYYGGGEHGVRYRNDIWYWTEIDAATKIARRLDIPADSFYSTQNPFFYKGEIYFLSNNTTEGFFGVNQFNPETRAIKETFRLKESGRLMGFNIIPAAN